MKKIEDLNYYELLEISPMATSQEIHKAYERIRRVYEPNSIALYSLFTPEETAVLNQRIEDAYRTLVYEDNRRRYDATLQGKVELPEPLPPIQPPRYQPQPVQPTFSLPSENRYIARAEAQPEPIQEKPPQAAAAPIVQFVGDFTGASIKGFREQKGLSIRNIADLTKVGARYLEYIEEENFSKLPARAYIRGFLTLYASALGCDSVRMVSDYLKRYDAVMNPPKK